MFCEVVAASGDMKRDGMYHSPRNPKTIDSASSTPVTRAYVWID